MNKAEIIEIIAEKANVTKVQANAVVNSFVKTISESLKDGGKVTLVGFGVFSVTTRSSRNSRNPRTGEAIKIDEKKVAKFKAEKELSDSINSNNRTIRKAINKV